MANATGNFPELLWPGIKELWGLSYKRYPKLYSRYMDVVKSDKAFEKFQGLTGLGLAGAKDEGASFQMQDMLQGYQKEAVNVTYGIGTIITREMFEDEQYNYINKVPGFLSESMRQTEETVAAIPFNNGFTTATTADGVALFSTAHVAIGGGGTFRNTPTVQTDLSQAALEQADIDLMDYKDERGLRIAVMPSKLLVAPTNKYLAEKILGTKFEVGNNDNTINPIAGSRELIVNPFLTDGDAWFVKTTVENGVIFVRRRNAEIARDNDWDTQNLKIGSTARFTVTQVDPRGWWGSSGA